MLRVACVFSVLLVAVVTADDKPHYDLKEAPALFDKFVREHHRVYKNDADREEHYKAFVKSLEVINDGNAHNDATFDINEFADYTPEEQKSMLGVRSPNDGKK